MVKFRLLNKSKLTTAVLIDDMPQAISVLQNDLTTFCPDIEIIDSASSVVEGAKLIKKTQPNIIFLDIMLGDGTGFDLLEILDDSLNYKVIFTTASDEHAIRAFRYAAVDYLLKPIDTEELQQAVKKAVNQLNTQQHQIPLLKEAYENIKPQRLALHTLDKVNIIEIEQIIRCESDNNCTWFFLQDGQKILVTKTLKHFDQILKDQMFIRCHQSHLINRHYVHEFIKRDGGYLILKDGSQIPVSVRKRQKVMNWLVELD